MIRPMNVPGRRWIAVGVLLGAVTPSPVSALPTAPRRNADPAGVDGAPAAAADDDAFAAERADATDEVPKRRPGVKQIEKEKPADGRLEDPDAARRAQWFGGMPGFPMQGMPFPMFPQPGFPVVPPGGAGAAAGAIAGDAQAFGFRSQVVMGGVMNGLPGNQGFVVQTWVIGPDGQAIRQPPAEVQPRPGAAKAKGPAGRGAKLERNGAGKDAAEKKAPARRTKQKARGLRDDAGTE